jgi:hypothetical protein
MRPRFVSLVLVACLVLGGCAGGTPPAASIPSLGTGSPTNTLASADLSPSPSPSPTRAWRHVPEQTAVNGTGFDDVIWTGTRFVASGRVPDGGGVILDSPDGLTWHSQPLAAPGGARVSLAAGPSGVVAVGGSDADHLASWFSPDGRSWQVTVDAFGSPAGTDSLTVTDVVAGNGLWVAVGREDPACNHSCGLAPVRARVWTSADGREWRPVDGEAALAGGAISSVTVGGPGFAAVGTIGTSAAVWLSADGSTWSAAPDSAVFHAQPGADPALWTEMTSVAASAGILVAVGTDGNGGGHGPAARAWRSVDGIAWTEAVGERFEGFTSGQDAVVARMREGFMAAFPVPDATCPSGLWGSAEGSAWTCASSDASFTGFVPVRVAESATAQVVVGTTTTDAIVDGPPGAIWIRDLP